MLGELPNGPYVAFLGSLRVALELKRLDHSLSEFEHCPSWLAPIVALAVCTGMRQSEILNLRWLDVDLSQGRILLPQTKNGEGRTVYLNETASAALLSLPIAEQTRSTDKVFDGVSADYVTQVFRKTCRSLAIEDFTFHDLRHTAASWLRMTGADIHSVATLLGHKDLRMARATIT